MKNILARLNSEQAIAMILTAVISIALILIVSYIPGIIMIGIMLGFLVLFVFAVYQLVKLFLEVIRYFRKK